MSALKEPEKKRYTREEYFAFEEKATERHEYHDGEILAMSGGTRNRSLLGGRAIHLLSSIFNTKGCHVFSSDIKVQIERFNQFVYPDASVVYGKLEDVDGRSDVINNPLIIVEVLSDSTEGYDRGAKFFKYRSLNSLQEYVLISQYQKQIDVFSRQEEKIWQMASYNEGQMVKLANLEVEFPLNDIYEGILG